MRGPGFCLMQGNSSGDFSQRSFWLQSLRRSEDALNLSKATSWQLFVLNSGPVLGKAYNLSLVWVDHFFAWLGTSRWSQSQTSSHGLFSFSFFLPFWKECFCGRWKEFSSSQAARLSGSKIITSLSLIEKCVGSKCEKSTTRLQGVTKHHQFYQLIRFINLISKRHARSSLIAWISKGLFTFRVLPVRICLIRWLRVEHKQLIFPYRPV